MTAPTPAAPRSRHPRLLAGVFGMLLLALVLALSTAALWRARQRALETNAVGSMRAYCSAQSMCRSGTGDLPYADYCHPYTELVTRKGRDGKPMELIAPEHAAARGPQGSPYHGYLFDDLRTIDGEPIDWLNDYGLCATPARYGVTGRRTFIVDTRGFVWGKDLGKSGFVKDYPSEPAS